MSQFTEETVTELKRAMLARMPECLYTAEDYAALTAKTGLNHAQIEQWAKNMRFRYGQEDRERWLQINELTEKVKFHSCYVSCFNVTPQFAENFILPKSRRGVGIFTLKYLHAAFDKDGEFGEFIMEFAEQIWQTRILERFEELGARQVSIITFDKHSKWTAFQRVLELGQKTGITVIRGTVPPDLAYVVPQAAKLGDAEFDEKTQNAIRASLADMEGKVEKVYSGVSEVKDGIGNVQDCVEQVIELQKSQTLLESENKRLTVELKRVNLLRDQLEQKVAKETEYRNKYEASLGTIAGYERALEAFKAKLLDKDKIIAMWESMNTVNEAMGCAQKLYDCSQASYRDAIMTQHNIRQQEQAMKRTRHEF